MSELSETVRPCADQSLPSRRRVVGGAAALGGTCLLTACGGGSSGGSASADSGSSDKGQDGSEGSGSASSPKGVPAADVSVGGGVIMGEADRPYVVTQPAQGEYRAFTATCTHTGCTVGSVENNEIVCPCHGSRFDAASGEVLDGPASGPLDQLTVTDEGGTLVVG